MPHTKQSGDKLYIVGNHIEIGPIDARQAQDLAEQLYSYAQWAIKQPQPAAPHKRCHCGRIWDCTDSYAGLWCPECRAEHLTQRKYRGTTVGRPAEDLGGVHND